MSHGFEHGVTFEGWLRLVDTHLVNWVGMSHDDMEDYLWHDRYTDNMTPYNAAQEFCEDVLDMHFE